METSQKNKNKNNITSDALIAYKISCLDVYNNECHSSRNSLEEMMRMPMITISILMVITLITIIFFKT
jgi:hypothetical protein